MYRKISAIVIPTLIAAGILGYMLYSIRDDLLIAFQHIIPLYFVVAVAICLCAWWLRGWRYHSILKSLNYNVGVTVSTACIFVSQTVNLIVPARLGDFVRVFILKHEFNTTYSEGVSSLVVERVFDIFTVALLGALSLFFVLNAPAWFTTLIIVPLAAGILFFAFLFFIGKFSSENKYIVIILNMLHEIKRASLSIRSITVLGNFVNNHLASRYPCLLCGRLHVRTADPLCDYCSGSRYRKSRKSGPPHTRRDGYVRSCPCDHIRSCRRSLGNRRRS